MTKTIRFTDKEWAFVFETLINVLGDYDKSIAGSPLSAFDTEAEAMALRSKLWIIDDRILKDLHK